MKPNFIWAVSSEHKEMKNFVCGSVIYTEIVTVIESDFWKACEASESQSYHQHSS